ncbi:MAG: hypothetical protein AAF804_06665 [Bacteroidota bacterium]
MQKFLFVLLIWLGGSLALLGQTPPHQLYAPHPLDSLTAYALDSLRVYFNDCNSGGSPEQRGLQVATYYWNPDGKIHSAVSYLLQNNQIRGRDSVAWIYLGDTVIQAHYELYSEDPDYKYNADYLDYGRLEDLYLPPFTERILVATDTLVMAQGRLAEKRDGYVRTHYRYDDGGRLVEIETINPEKVAMDMGGYSWKTFTYDDKDQLSYKSHIITGPDNFRDTSVQVFQYDSEGNLLTEIRPVPSVPGVSSMRQFEYENGQLIRESVRRSTFRSSGPPNYTREQISILFETTYRYEGDHLVEKKATRDGELDSDGWYQYRYQDQGLMTQKIMMNPYTEAPGQVYTYEYFFRD